MALKAMNPRSDSGQNVGDRERGMIWTPMVKMADRRRPLVGRSMMKPNMPNAEMMALRTPVRNGRRLTSG